VKPLKITVAVADRGSSQEKGYTSEDWCPWAEIICEWFTAVGAKEAAYGATDKDGHDYIVVFAEFTKEPDEPLVADIVLREPFKGSPFMLDDRDPAIMKPILKAWRHRERGIAQRRSNVKEAIHLFTRVVDGADFAEFKKALQDRHGLNLEGDKAIGRRG
jgi:hypothetical protein